MINLLRGVALALVLATGVEAQAPNQPVVFLPGFMGSDLIDEHGTIVCCYPENLGPGLQRMELPENPLETTYRPYGVIESYSVLGPFKVGAYSAISDLFSELGFEKDRDLFYFPYDWRLSNFRNAERLHEFVQSQRALRDQPFRIVGHSMGGVIARVFVHEYGDQHRVTSVVTMATPFLGSQHALKSLLQGYGFVVNLINGGDELPRKVMASFESTYEMLPAYDKCCFVTTPGTNGREAVDVLERSTWVDLGWLKSPLLPSKELVASRLESADRIRSIMKTPPPVGTTLYKIVGSNISTLARVWLDSAGQPIDWIEANGDGVVTEHSASNGDWLGTFPAIEVHADIFRDEHVQVLLKRLLTKDTSLSEFSALVDQLQAAPRHESLLRASKAPVYGYTGSGGSSKAIETMGGSVALHSLKIETARSYLSPAEPSWVRLRLLSPGPNALVPSRNAEPIAGVTVIGIIRSGTAEESAETSVDVHEVEPGVYEAPFVAPATPGTYRLALLVPGIGEIAETIVVRSDTSELDAPSAK